MQGYVHVLQIRTDRNGHWISGMSDIVRRNEWVPITELLSSGVQPIWCDMDAILGVSFGRDGAGRGFRILVLDNG